MIKQAVFLVGGKGTRLGSLTQTIPKPLLEIAPGIRFLDVVLYEAARHGFTDILLLAGHLGEQVEAAYQGRTILDARVQVVRELEPQGTGGALAFAAHLLEPWFVMANGDSLFEFNLRALTMPLPAGKLGRLALRTVPDPSRYGAVRVEGTQIVGFEEKSPNLQGPMPINGGVYMLSRDILNYVDGPCSIEQDVFPKLVEKRALDAQEFDGYFLDIGLPNTYSQACVEVAPRMTRPIAFLDRDGVLNQDSGYTHRAEDLIWMPGAKEAIRLLNDEGYYVIVATNQAGIARGFYDEAAVMLFHEQMQHDLSDVGAHLDGIYMCPFHPEGTVPAYTAEDHPDRKPNPGMLLKAFADWPNLPSRSFLIGDRDSDLQAASAGGIASYLYQGGDLRETVRQALLNTIQPS
jgi:D,D-heptose 1,7-bisphosphate phosphatase